jgi:RNA polymerase sigma-70 factor (ECF subfamily)
MDAIPDSPSRKQLVSLLLKHRQRIFGFVFTLVQNRSDAEDILQEASMIMWEKFDDFRPESDFVAWANQIGYFCVQNFRRRQGRSKLLFDDSLIENLADTASQLGEEIDRRHRHLRDCLGLLRPRDREMILARYALHGSVAKAAEVARRTLAATYKSLNRVRRSLSDCITQKLAAEGSP